MKNKSRKPVVKGILKIGTMIEITDPAEKAALDRRCREAEKAMANGQSEKVRARRRK